MRNETQARFAVVIREQLARPIILQITLWHVPKISSYAMIIFLPAGLEHMK